MPRSERRRIVAELQRQAIPVLQIPSVDDLTSGRARIDALRPVAIEDLLGRDPVPELLGPGLRDAVVCVTGAGGSIGSELCRQILQLSPSILILLESSEPSLYAVEQELRQQLPASVTLLPVLGSASDPALVQRLFADRDVQTVFHAAAYKHVPLVESNPLAGLANNVGSPRVVCQAAVAQASALEISKSAKAAGQPRTLVAMVRFGNVLGSSGSVVPLFRKQIAAGGPITLTHPEIIRCFMTIPEAAQLVLQASCLAKGGDVFLLDMGEPVRIKDLAVQMVRLSGLSLRDRQNPNGDIEIVCTGLRPGEELYEELLIQAESQPTKHSLIFRATERSLHPQDLWPRLDQQEEALKIQNQGKALDILSEPVPEWKKAQN